MGKGIAGNTTGRLAAAPGAEVEVVEATGVDDGCDGTGPAAAVGVVAGATTVGTGAFFTLCPFAVVLLFAWAGWALEGAMMGREKQKRWCSLCR